MHICASLILLFNRLLLCPNEDLFEHFAALASRKKLPSYEELEIHARKLYRNYTSLRAQERALKGDHTFGAESIIPIGRPWPRQPENKDANPAAKDTETTPEFKGDQTLMRSIAFINDAMLAREFSLATASGDVGRIWEVFKLLVFSFAGSSHSKYAQYTLEMVTVLELESSADLRRGLLQMTVVNLTGHEGHWAAADYTQEYFNRLLEAVVGKRKGADYGEDYICRTWSRNLHRIARLKLSMLDSVGLNVRSRRHTGATYSPETKILLDHYRDTELHTFRRGRTYSKQQYISDFLKGQKSLQDGKLERFKKKTTRARNILGQQQSARASSPTDSAEAATPRKSNEVVYDIDSDLDSDDEELPELPILPFNRQGLRMSSVVDSELVVESTEDADRAIREILDGGIDSEDDNDF